MRDNASARGISQLVGKIGILNVKLDKIIDLLSSTGEKKSEPTGDKAEKGKKLKNAKADKIVKTLTSTSGEDAGPTTDNA